LSGPDAARWRHFEQAGFEGVDEVIGAAMDFGSARLSARWYADLRGGKHVVVQRHKS